MVGFSSILASLITCPCKRDVVVPLHFSIWSRSHWSSLKSFPSAASTPEPNRVLNCGLFPVPTWLVGPWSLPTWIVGTWSLHVGFSISSERCLSPSSGPQLPPAHCCSRPYYGPAASAMWAKRASHISTPLVIFVDVKVTPNTKIVVLYHVILMYIPNMLIEDTYKLLCDLLVLISPNGI